MKNSNLLYKGRNLGEILKNKVFGKGVQGSEIFSEKGCL